MIFLYQAEKKKKKQRKKKEKEKIIKPKQVFEPVILKVCAMTQ